MNEQCRLPNADRRTLDEALQNHCSVGLRDFRYGGESVLAALHVGERVAGANATMRTGVVGGEFAGIDEAHDERT